MGVLPRADLRAALDTGARGQVRSAIAFVQLAASDGSFEALDVLSAPRGFAPISAAQAMQIAGARLARGERIAGARLTWDARPIGDRAAHPRFARSPIQPYYELAIERAGAPVGRVQVALDGRGVARLR